MDTTDDNRSDEESDEMFTGGEESLSDSDDSHTINENPSNFYAPSRTVDRFEPGGRGSGRFYGKRGGDDILSNNTLKRLRDNAEALPKLGSRSQKDLSDYSLTTPIIAGRSRQDKQSLRQSEERQTPGRRVEEQTPGRHEEEQTPGRRVEKQTPGRRVEKQTPGRHEEETPGCHEEEQIPELHEEEHGVGDNETLSPCVESTSNVASVLGELTNTLKQIVNRLDKQETRLASMENKIESPAVSSSSSGGSQRPKIPLAVRVCYLLLLNTSKYLSHAQ